MSIIVGLTGPTGAGKTTLTPVAEELGFKVVDCDKIARSVTEKGEPALKDLVKVFGEDILFNDGSLNRKALAKKAFSTEEQTKLLNKTIFPFITLKVEKECQCERVLLDAPTLFESGIDSICVATVALLAEKDVRLKRIMARDKIDEKTALIRMNAGKPDEFYLEKADFILNDVWGEEGVKSEFSQILKKILKEQ